MSDGFDTAKLRSSGEVVHNNIERFLLGLTSQIQPTDLAKKLMERISPASDDQTLIILKYAP